MKAETLQLFRDMATLTYEPGRPSVIVLVLDGLAVQSLPIMPEGKTSFSFHVQNPAQEVVLEYRTPEALLKGAFILPRGAMVGDIITGTFSHAQN